ncbi:MAG TPA: hypothetical protein PKC24_07615 [Cyclobacteriaceae bacterium]|nr:hypothetical protein [Cyclobacteriaceae bacterium]
MIAHVREAFNQQFSEQQYADFLADLNQTYNFNIAFRVAESPIFVDKIFAEKLFKVADEIIDFIVQPDFKKQMQGALPAHLHVPNESNHTLFLALDFAVCTDGSDELVPRLIEMQGFPSLFGYQDFLGSKYREHFNITENLNYHFGLSSNEYWDVLRKAILKNHDVENVVLLEVEPYKQNTAIDFVVSHHKLGIPVVDLSDVILRNKKLYYKKEGKEIEIKRIYNRVIFDELLKRTDLNLDFHLTEEAEVEWAGHPNWFFYISKYTMPFLNCGAVPACKFLNEFSVFPTDLENYVLKPLFSFSGTGVIFNVTESDLLAIPTEERKNYLLQRKVNYKPVIQAPDGLVKAEIRLLFLWDEHEARPKLITNLARLSRGEMIGVKYNKNKTWVGGTICFFEID